MRKILDIMKKEPMFSTAIIMGVITIITTGSIYAADTVKKSNLISEASAKNFAYMDAKVKDTDVLSSKAQLEKEDGRYVYDVDFETADCEYDYTVDAADGRILEREKELIAKNEDVSRSESKKDDSSEKYISIDEAKKKALEAAGIDEKNIKLVSFTKAKLEWEDGKPYYDIVFNTDDAEWKVKISAYEGEANMISFESEHDPDTDSSQEINGSTSDAIEYDDASQNNDSGSRSSQDKNSSSNKKSSVNESHRDDDDDDDDKYDRDDDDDDEEEDD